MSLRDLQGGSAFRQIGVSATGFRSLRSCRSSVASTRASRTRQSARSRRSAPTGGSCRKIRWERSILRSPLTTVPDRGEVVARNRRAWSNPVLIFPFTVTKPSVLDLNVIGVVPNGVGAPVVTDGRALKASGEAVADKSAGFALGDTLHLHGLTLHVVGRTHGISYNAGTPTVFAPFDDSQHLLFPGGKKGDPVRGSSRRRGVGHPGRGTVSHPPPTWA